MICLAWFEKIDHHGLVESGMFEVWPGVNIGQMFSFTPHIYKCSHQKVSQWGYVGMPPLHDAED